MAAVRTIKYQKKKEKLILVAPGSVSGTYAN